MNFTELNNAANRHPWRFSLLAGMVSALVAAAFFGDVTRSVLVGLVHTVLQLLGFAWERRRLAKAADAGRDGRSSSPRS